MAYTHSKYEVRMDPVLPSGALATTVIGNILNATGVQGRWQCGFVPHIIRGAAVVQLSTVIHTDPVHIAFNADISVQGTATRLGKIVLPTAGAVDKVVYWRPTYKIEVPPGRLVEAAVTAAATNGIQGRIILYVEPRWEEPANVTGMLQTT